MLSRPGESGDGSDEYIVEDFERCWWRAPQGEPPTTDMPSDYWNVYQQDLEQVYAELWDLRQGTPTVLITIDLYNPSLPAQIESGIADECIAWFEAWSAVIAEEAEANGSRWCHCTICSTARITISIRPCSGTPGRPQTTSPAPGIGQLRKERRSLLRR